MVMDGVGRDEFAGPGRRDKDISILGVPSKLPIEPLAGRIPAGYRRQGVGGHSPAGSSLMVLPQVLH